MFTMKNLYQCEKCGKTYCEYDEAHKCEESHLELDMNSAYRNLSELIVYKEGSTVPSEIVIRSSVQGKYNFSTQEYDEIPPVYARYALKTLLNKHDTAAFEKKRLEEKAEQQRRDDEYWAKHRREKAEKKAAEEAAVKAALEATQEGQEMEEALAV